MQAKHRNQTVPSLSSTLAHHLRQPRLVGSPQLDTNSISRMQPPKTATGILAYDHQGKLLHAKAQVGTICKDAKHLALEAIRAAQLLAFQLGWKMVVIRNDVQEIVSMLHKNSGFPTDLLTIATDIILLTNLFDDCHFLYVNRQKNKICRKLSFRALEFPNLVSWDACMPAWLSWSCATMGQLAFCT